MALTMHSLPLFVRLTGRPVILLGSGEAAHAKRALLDRAGAMVVGEEAEASLAIVAIESDLAAEAAVARLKARGVLVNAVDRPALCDFTLPAIVDRHPVLIAIGTGGASAGLAKALRQRLEVLLPATLGGLATGLKMARGKIRERWPDATDRRRAIDAGFDPGGPLDPFGADQHVDRWLAEPEPERVAITGLHRVSLVSDDPDDLTLRTARLLGQADVIIHDIAVSPAILARARADAVRIAALDVPDPLPDGLIVHLIRNASP